MFDQYFNKVFRYGLVRIPKFFYPFYLQHQRFLVKRDYKIKKGIICLTFDNDYKKDNEATDYLFPLFKKYNLKATWAIVGLWVKKYPELHEKLINNGHELMNHSWSHPDNMELRPHDTRKFNDISSSEVEAEITKAHQYVLNTLGYTMTGFRMPHFCKHPHVRIVLSNLGYSYTSNHFSIYAPTLGVPYRTNEGWAEVPLSGIPRIPSRIFETYRIFRNPDGLYANEGQFYNDFCKLVDITEKYKLISTLYMDASDVVKFSQPGFEKYLDYIERRNVNVCTLREVADFVLNKS